MTSQSVTPMAVKPLPRTQPRRAARGSRLAPVVFHRVISGVHRILPRAVRARVPATFLGYALINGSAFLIDISFLWVFYEKLHWFYPLAVTVGYAIAGVYSLLLNRWLNFQ